LIIVRADQAKTIITIRHDQQVATSYQVRHGVDALISGGKPEGKLDGADHAAGSVAGAAGWFAL
jgi:hypothetical protein